MGYYRHYRSSLQSYFLLLWTASGVWAIIVIIEAVFIRIVSRMDGCRLMGYCRHYRSSLQSLYLLFMDRCRLLLSYCLRYLWLHVSNCLNYGRLPAVIDVLSSLRMSSFIIQCCGFVIVYFPVYKTVYDERRPMDSSRISPYYLY